MDDLLFEAYDRVCGRIRDLLSDPSIDMDAEVPACPGWAVRDVVAHLAGLATDVIAGNTEHYAERSWTQAQVDARRSRAVSDILDEWAAATPQLAAAQLPPVGRPFESLGRLVFLDASVHEHDLRGAVGRPDPDNEAAVLGLEAVIFILRKLLRRAQEGGSVPALQIVAVDGGSWRVGPADAAAPDAAATVDASTADVVTVEGTAFELWRGLTGRRSIAQLRSLRWSADPTPFLAHWTLGPLPFSEQPLPY